MVFSGKLSANMQWEWIVGKFRIMPYITGVINDPAQNIIFLYNNGDQFL